MPSILKKINFKNRPAQCIALVLILSFATLLAGVASVSAVDVTTYAYISAEPSPIGVNQELLVSVWILPLQPTGTDVFHSLTVAITRPDGTTETKGPLTTSTVGSQFFIYNPSMVGTYSFKLNYPGETFTRGGYYYKPAESPTINVVVQQDPVQPYQDNPTPTDYWTRPINGQNRAWACITGDWLMSGYNATGKTFDAQFGFNPYSQAPRSAHIMWTKALGMGGIVGGDLGEQSYYAGLSYESKAAPAIIIAGRLYYNVKPLSSVNQGFVCVDLRTGEEIWRHENWADTITLGQVFEYTSGNQGGVAGAYLWQTGTTYKMFDAFTGDLFLTFANATTGTNVMDNNGNWYVYVYSGVGRWLAMWNFSRAIDQNRLITYNPSGDGMYRPTPRSVADPSAQPYDWLRGIQWNRTDLPEVKKVITDTLPNGTQTTTTLRPALFGVTGNTLLAQVGSPNYPQIYYELGYSLTDGSQKWVAERNTETPSVWGSTGAGKYIRVFLATRTHRCYDANTGQQLWESEAMDFPWGSFGSQYGTVAYGKFYWGGYDGHEYAFDLNTGQIVWKFGSGEAGYETPYGSYPFWYGPVIAGGVIFTGTGEHSPTQPLIRGERLYAIDAESGQEVWSISGLMVTRSISDGYLTTYNAYDNQLYCFGKGPSATTVAAPQVAVAAGTPMTITGTVTDQSTGQAGTAAISDADMSTWMEYLHMQQPIPDGVTVHGVDVIVTATAQDGSVTTVGTTTSEMSGKFGISWTPTAAGLYKITATFVGSESYGSSFDDTFVTVTTASGEPVEPSGSPSAAAPGGNITSETLLIIGAVIVVIIIVAVAAVLLRKRK